MQTPKKSEDDEAVANILPINVANGEIKLSMGKAMAGISSQAAHLPKIAAISPSLSLPKLQGNGTAAGHQAGQYGQVGHQGKLEKKSTLYKDVK